MIPHDLIVGCFWAS